MKQNDEFEKIETWKMGMEWDVAIQEMKRRREAAKHMGGSQRVAEQHKLGKLTVRERIERLVDPGSFLEMGSLMGQGEYDEKGDLVNFMPSGYVTGLGDIDKRPVVVGGEDFTIRGGSGTWAKKDPRFFALPMAIEYGIPAVQLCDGAGASAADYESSGRMRLPASGEIWWWSVQALQKVPVISAIMGPAAGHVAGHAMLCHFSIMVKGTGTVFPAGPPVVARALTREISKEELGGTWLHTRETGVVDNEAKDEDDCFAQIKRFLSYVPDNVCEVTARKDLGDDPNRREEALLGIVPIQRKRPYDMYKLIRLLVDKGDFFEMRGAYGKGVITVFARMDGYVVGVLASNPMHNAGAIDGKAAQKMARFIDLCNFFNIPVVELPDVPGFMIGPEAEAQGTMRYGMNAIMAACEAKVPKIQINLRKSYGMGGGAFNSVGGMLNLNLRLGWPGGEWGAIPIEGGVAAAYRRDIESSADPDARRKELEDKLINLRTPFRAAEAGDVMDIIDPRDTRPIICRFLRAAQPALKRNAGPKRSVRP